MLYFYFLLNDTIYSLHSPKVPSANTLYILELLGVPRAVETKHHGRRGDLSKETLSG